MPRLHEKDSKPRKKPSSTKAQTSAAIQTVLTETRKNAPRPDDLETDVMRHKQKKWLDKAKKPAKETARSKATGAVRRVAPKVTRVAGPAATVGSALGGPSQAPKQTSKQIRGFEKKNPGWTVVKTKSGFKTVRK